MSTRATGTPAARYLLMHGAQPYTTPHERCPGNTMSRFLHNYLDGLALGVYLLLHPIGWVLVLVAMASAITAIFREQQISRIGWLVLLWPIATSSVATAIGLAFPHSDGFESAAPQGPAMALDVLIGVHSVGCLLLVWLADGFRLLAIPALCVGSLGVVGCLVLAMMSVSGIWM